MEHTYLLYRPDFSRDGSVEMVYIGHLKAPDTKEAFRRAKQAGYFAPIMRIKQKGEKDVEPIQAPNARTAYRGRPEANPPRTARSDSYV